MGMVGKGPLSDPFHLGRDAGRVQRQHHRRRLLRETGRSHGGPLGHRKPADGRLQTTERSRRLPRRTFRMAGEEQRGDDLTRAVEDEHEISLPDDLWGSRAVAAAHCSRGIV